MWQTGKKIYLITRDQERVFFSLSTNLHIFIHKRIRIFTVVYRNRIAAHVQQRGHIFAKATFKFLVFFLFQWEAEILQVITPLFFESGSVHKKIKNVHIRVPLY